MNNNITNVKMFLFARWLSTCYADTYLDDNKLSEQDKGFNPINAISMLNRKDGYWYKEKLDYFNKVVYHNYFKNGTVSDTEEFLINNK